MFDKVLKAFWKALTPDLVADEPGKPASTLDKTVLAALGGAGNIKTEQRVALTRIRVELADITRLDPQALRVAGVPGILSLPGGVAKGHSWQANTACGSGLARDWIAAVLQVHHSAVIASKPAPT